MSINFEIETRRINVGKGYFTVRGMSADEITFLTMTYLNDMKAVVARYGDSPTIQKNRVAELVMDVAKDFPGMVVEIISRCADATAPEDLQKFRQLAFPIQVLALKEIVLLTVEDGGIELGNAARLLASLLEANGLKPGPLTTLLQNTIATSEKASPS